MRTVSIYLPRLLAESLVCPVASNEPAQPRRLRKILRHHPPADDLGRLLSYDAVLEFLGKPVRAFFDLRDQVRAQLLLLANVAAPKPRETISTSLEIQQYDVALKAGREAQRILRDLGSQMLAFSESEIAACNGIATFGFDAVAAGRGLIALSNTYYRNMTDRADFSSKVEKALRFKARDGSAREWSSRSLRGWARAQRAAFRRAQAQALSACEVERRRFSWAHIRRPSVFEKAR